MGGARADQCLDLLRYASARQLGSTNDSGEERCHVKGKKQFSKDCLCWCKQQHHYKSSCSCSVGRVSQSATNSY